VSPSLVQALILGSRLVFPNVWIDIWKHGMSFPRHMLLDYKENLVVVVAFKKGIIG
jgi:hypothetical protein